MTLSPKNYVIGAGAVLLLASVLAVSHLHKVPSTPTVQSPAVPQGAHIITLTSDGFSPTEITIKQGETITFENKTGKPFWPASNLHPSHLLYPEFDPKQPIPPPQSWSFTFTKVGEWRFHDHLAPYFTGTITVMP